MTYFDELLAGTLEGEGQPFGQPPPQRLDQRAPNEFDLALEEAAREKQQRLKNAERLSSETSPDQRAESLRLSERFATPPAVVERNVEEFRKLATQEDDKFNQILDASPGLKDWVAKNPDRAPVVRDDAESLSAIDHALRLAGEASREFAGGLFRFGGGTIYGTLAGVSDVLAPLIGGRDPGAARLLGDVFRNLEMHPRLTAESLEPDLSQASQLKRDIFGGIGSLGQMSFPMALTGGTAILRPTLVAGAQIGRQLLMRFQLGAMGASSGGQAYTEAIEQGLSVPAAAIRGGTSGSIEILTEYLPAVYFFRDIATRPGLWRMLLSQIGAELPGESLATTLDDLSRWSTLPENRTKTFADYLQAWPSSMASTAIGTIVAVGALTTASRGTQVVLERLGEAAKNSKTLGRSPETLEHFVGQSGAPKTLYVPVDAFTTYYQEQGLDVRAQATALTGDALAYDHAVEAGTPLAIPTGRYVTQVANTAHAEWFAAEATFQPDGTSARAADEALTENQALATQVEDAVQAAATRTETPETAQAPVRQALVGQLLADPGFTELAARERVDALELANVYGAGVEQVLSTLATKAGMAPLDLLAQLGLAIGEQTPMLAAAVQAIQDVAPGGATGFARQQAFARGQEAPEASGATPQGEDDLTPGDPRPTQAEITLEQAARRPLPKGFEAVSPHLLPEERKKIQAAVAGRALVAFKGLPGESDYVDVALAGIAKRGWYRRSAAAIREVFGEVDAPRFAGLLAALSPQTSVESNLFNAVSVWRAWTAAGRPTDVATLEALISENVQQSDLQKETSALRAWVPNSIRALATEDTSSIRLSGDKVNPFMLNLLGHTQQVTTDAWMTVFAATLHAVTGDGIQKASHLALAAKVRRAAKKISALTGETWTPDEVQETVWSWTKTLYEMAGAANYTAEEFLAKGFLTDEMVASTPDFAKLFANDAPVRAHLEAAGYGPVIDALTEETTDADGGGPGGPVSGGRATGREGAAAPVTPALLRSARRLDHTARRRATVSRTAVDYADLLAKAREGGFTYSLIKGSHPASGFSLSFHPELTERVVLSEYPETEKGRKALTNRLFRYAARNVDILRQPKNNFGAWHNAENGELVLDVSRVVATPERAQAEGFARDQVAAFNLDRPAVVAALTKELGRPPTDDEVVNGQTLVIEYPRGHKHGETWEGEGGPFAIDEGPNPGQGDSVGGPADSRADSGAILPPDGPQDGARGPGRGPEAIGDRAEDRAAVAVSVDPKGKVTLYQSSPDAPRGSIELGPKSARVRFTETADLSTFLHETGHLYLHIMGGLAEKFRGGLGITKQQGALGVSRLTAGQRGLVEDYDRILTFLGVASRDDIKTEHHEKFAQAFEAYLRLGKAPTPNLSRPFSRYRSWLTKLYRTLVELPVDLNPEIVGVFNRMLASDDAISAAERDVRMEPTFATADQAGMTPFEWEAYQDELQKAHETAREALTQRLMKELQRERTTWWQARRAEVEAEVREALRNEPAQRALLLLQRGEQPDGTPHPAAPIKLAKDDIVEAFGEARLKTLPLPWVYAVKDGVTADAAAELMGFSSGDELLTALADAPHLETEVQRQTAARMQLEFGNMRVDGTLRAAAEAEVADNGFDAVLQAELKALAKKARQVRPFVAAAKREEAAEEASARRATRSGLAQASLSEAALREIAEQRVGAMAPVDFAPHLYWVAAQKESNLAAAALTKGRYEEAVDAKKRQRMALAMHRAMTRAVDEVDTIARLGTRLGQVPAQARLGKAGEQFQKQVNAILGKFEFKRVTRPELERRELLTTWVEEQQEAGYPIEIPAELLETAQRQNYRTVSMDRLRQIRDALIAINHLASEQNKLTTAGKDATYQASRDALVASLADLATRKPYTAPHEIRGWKKTQNVAEQVFASHWKMGELTQRLDGYVDNGPMWRLTTRVLNRAADMEVQRMTAEGKRYEAILSTHYTGSELGGWNRQVHIPAIGRSLSKEAILAVALNWGNATSRDRIVSDQVRKWSPAQVEAILDTLDARDWQFVQDTWDFVNSFWTEISDKHFRLTGLRPEKVEAVPVQTKFGTLRGGYYPLKYDHRLSWRAQRNQAVDEAKLQMAGAYIRTTTRRGHEKARLEHVESSVKLEIGVLFGHLDQVVHDLTHHEALIDVSRILRDPKVARAINQVLSPAYAKQLDDAVTDVAIGRISGENWLDKGFSYMKGGTQVAGLGLNMWTAVQQPLGLTIGMNRVGAKWVALGMRRWMKDAATTTNTLTWVRHVSPFMANRMTTMSQDMNDLRNAVSEPGGWFDVAVRKVSRNTATQKNVIDSFLWHIGIAQRFADIPTWLGQYLKSTDQGMTEEDAIAVADQAVRDSQGGGQLIDRAKVQRLRPSFQLFMVFYSYGALVFNQTARVYHATGKLTNPVELAKFLGGLSLIYLLPNLLKKGLKEALRGALGGDDDRDETPLEFGTDILSESAGDVLNTMVGLRELGGLTRPGNRGYQGPTGTRLITQAMAAVEQGMQFENDESLWRALNAAGGPLLWYPSTALQRVIDGFTDLSEGKSNNPANLLFGRERKRQ